MTLDLQAVAAALAALATILGAGGAIASRTRIALYFASHIALVRRILSLETQNAQLKSQVANGETNARLATFTREEAERLETRVVHNEDSLRAMRRRQALLDTHVRAWIAYTQALEAALIAAGIPLPAGRPEPLPSEDEDNL